MPSTEFQPFSGVRVSRGAQWSAATAPWMTLEQRRIALRSILPYVDQGAHIFKVVDIMAKPGASIYNEPNFVGVKWRPAR